MSRARSSAGDRIRIPPVRVAERGEPEAAPHFRLPVLFEDDWILAIDKPAGLAVHGGSGVAHGVIESLRSMRPEAQFLELVHRLDRETSGVLLLAKKRSALTALHEMLRTHDMDKRYLVAVAGRFRNERQRVRLALAKRTTREGERRVSVSDEGQEAETVFHRLARGAEDTSLLEAELLTGRTHQIRVHLAHLKHPVLGDDEVRRLRAEQGAAQARPQAHVPARVAPVASPSANRRDARARVAACPRTWNDSRTAFARKEPAP